MLEISASAFLVMLGSIVSFSLYTNLLKKYPENKFSLFFWTHIFSYTFFTIFVIIYEIFEDQEHASAIKELVTDTTVTNLPFYIAEAAITIAAVFAMKRLIALANYPTVLVLTQITALFSAIQFAILGNTTTTHDIIGLSIITIGALISGLKTFAPPSIKNYNFTLLKAGALYALLQSSRAGITYLCTAKMNPTTQTILQTLTRHMHIIPFAPITPLHFNIGVQFLTVISLFVYIVYYMEKPESIINGIKNSPKILFSVSVSFTAFAFFFYKAFGMVGDKDLVTGAQKLAIPLTIYIAYKLYKTKPTKQAIAGMITILAGSAYIIFV